MLATLLGRLTPSSSLISRTSSSLEDKTMWPHRPALPATWRSFNSILTTEVSLKWTVNTQDQWDCILSMTDLLLPTGSSPRSTPQLTTNTRFKTIAWTRIQSHTPRYRSQAILNSSSINRTPSTWSTFTTSSTASALTTQSFHLLQRALVTTSVSQRSI